MQYKTRNRASSGSFNWRLYVCGKAVALAMLALGTAPLCASTPETLTDEQVLSAIRKGTDFVLAQRKDNSFERSPIKSGSVLMTNAETCLSLYTLLLVGKSVDDPRLSPRSTELAPVVKYVQEFQPDTTYVAAFRVNALSLLPPTPENQKTLREATSTLVRGGLATGGWDYTLHTLRKPEGSNDTSVSQYGLLGVWTAAQLGVEIPTNFWPAQDRWWRKNQLPDGRWPYHDGEGANGALTAAGIASLFITSEFTDTTLRLVSKPDKNLQSGLAWLDKNFSAETDNLYYLYGVERVGLAGGVKFLNKTDWYRAAAARLIKRQQADGSWIGEGYDGSENRQVSTCLALLFLTRGRNPVVFNKLRYDGPWDARPRDAANVTSWMSRKFEKPLNWQFVDLAFPTEQLLDAPVLLITGSKGLAFKPEEIAKLRDYVRAGGMIFSTSDGGREEYHDSIRKISAEVCDRKYEFRVLPPKHPIFSVWASVKTPPQLLGLSNGSRELWIHSPDDLGASWQRRNYASASHFEIPANVFFYANGKGTLRPHLQSLAVPTPEKQPTRAISLARIDYAGNFDPEPGAWPRLARLAATSTDMDIRLATVPLAQLDVSKTPVAHLTGNVEFAFGEAERSMLMKFLANGGVLLVDSCGGSAAFTGAFTKLLSTMYPDQPLVPLAADHPIYTGVMDRGLKVNAPPSFRPFSAQANGGTFPKPRLQVLTLNGRAAVIFSEDDLTSGLLGTNTWGIAGYTPESAQLLARNFLIWTTQARQENGAATQPAK